MVINRVVLFACAMIAISPRCRKKRPHARAGRRERDLRPVGKIGETVFNGVLRIKIIALREADAARPCRTRGALVGYRGSRREKAHGHAIVAA